MNETREMQIQIVQKQCQDFHDKGYSLIEANNACKKIDILDVDTIKGILIKVWRKNN